MRIETRIYLSIEAFESLTIQRHETEEGAPIFIAKGRSCQVEGEGRKNLTCVIRITLTTHTHTINKLGARDTSPANTIRELRFRSSSPHRGERHQDKAVLSALFCSYKSTGTINRLDRRQTRTTKKMGDKKSTTSTVNDPVYAQWISAPASPDAAAAETSKPGKGAVSPATDPVYSQSATTNNKSDGRSSSSSEIETQVNDPVYSQILSAPAAPITPSAAVAATRPGQGTVSPENDPVYSQQQTQTQVNDPVYSQTQSAPAAPGTQTRPGQGTISPENDPVYSQGQQTQAQTQTQATSRLQQLSSQVSPAPSLEPAETHQANSKRTRKSKRSSKSSSSGSSTDLPDDYSDILAHISKLQSIASTPNPNNRGYIRQKTAGKLWARERISQLVDEGTWREIGSVTGTVSWKKDADNPQREHIEDFTPSNNPQGFGRITCPRTGQRRQIYLTADDFSIRSGHADGATMGKTLHGESLALKLKVPVVKLVDGSSGGGSVSTIMSNGYSYVPHVLLFSTVIKQLNAGIPNLGAVLGPAIGLGAARVVSTHFSVMAADIGSLFNAGPKVVEGATFEEGLSFADLGGPYVHCTNGTIDNLAQNEAECFEQIRTVLGYLPDCGELQAPPVSACRDDVNREDIALRSVIPRRKARMYNPYTIIESVVDGGSWFEIGRLWGRTGITGLARLGGRPVGVLSLNCEVNSGALDALGSQKLMKMIKFCDVFNLPILQFVDVRKYLVHKVTLSMPQHSSI